MTHSNDDLVPYSVTLNLKVPKTNSAFKIRYSYSLWEDNKLPEWERDPSRTLEILPSEDYNGQLGKQNAF